MFEIGDRVIINQGIATMQRGIITSGPKVHGKIEAYGVAYMLSGDGPVDIKSDLFREDDFIVHHLELIKGSVILLDKGDEK